MIKKQNTGNLQFRRFNPEYRDIVLYLGSKLLSYKFMKKSLWYVETLVLSARFLQRINLKKNMQHSQGFSTRKQLWKLLEKKLDGNYIALEFGVASASATRFWANTGIKFKKWFGFDTFTGLPEDWKRGGVSVLNAGTFDQSSINQNGMPTVKADYEIIWIKGLIEKTLTPEFIDQYRDNKFCIFIDVDLYEPTLHILKILSSYLKNGDLIYFDEAFDPWNEWKAIDEMSSQLPEFKAIAHTGSALLIEIL